VRGFALRAQADRMSALRFGWPFNFALRLPILFAPLREIHFGFTQSREALFKSQSGKPN
jgi:hypothetical protein